MDKQALIEKIQGLDGLTNDEKSDLLGLLRSHKKYGLVWEDKPEDVEERLRDELPVLTEVKERALISDAPDAPNHILIEGDNLEALTALSYTHEGKVDVIYIDPPYNTGKKKEFKYNDSWIDKDDLYKHSKWCSFIWKRIKIAKTLLSDSGVIFISIDDHECSQLKSMCDTIFKEINFICNFIWYTEGHTDNQDIITGVHEYILCYAKNVEYITPNHIVDPNTSEDSKILRDYAENSIVKNGIKNPPSYITLPKGFPCEVESLNKEQSNDIEAFLKDIEQLGYISREISTQYHMSYPVRCNGMHVSNYKLNEDCMVFSGWMNPNKLKAFIQNKFEPIYDEESNTYTRFYLSKNGVVYYRKEGRMSHYVQTVLQNLGTTETNKYMLERMGVSFEHPKPLELIKFLLSLFSIPNSRILDFFAGSGTTLHATMQLNTEDGGHRQCILVTSNEEDICENVTYERNKRVIQGYTPPKGKEVPGLTANTLRYYKTDFISRDRTQRNMHALVEAATELLCIKEDLYNEQTHFGQYKTHPKVLRYFAQDNKRMLVLYRDEYTEEVAAEIEHIDLPEGEKIKVYIFSPDRYAYDDMFQDVAEKVTLVALPAAIYDAYKKVLPKRKEKLLELVSDNDEANEEGGEQ